MTVSLVPTPLPATRAQPPTATTDEQQAERTLDIHDLFDVQYELSNVAHRWNDVGLALRLNPDTLKTVEAQYRDPKSCLREVLTEWLKKSYDTNRFGQPSWRLLVRAVAHPAGGNNRALAEQIAARHNVPLPPPLS
jgi:hypothetical protein